jgi:hypothetical protein
MEPTNSTPTPNKPNTVEPPTQPSAPEPSTSTASPATPTLQPQSLSTSPAPSPVQNTPAPAAPGNTVQVGGAKPKRKWLIPGVAAAALLIALLGGGYVLGMYLPNKPETVYKTSLQRTNKAAETFFSQDSQLYKKEAAVTMDGTFKLQGASMSADGSFTGKTDMKNTVMTVDANAMGQKYRAEIRALATKQSTNPDIYLKLTGIKPTLEQLGMTQLVNLDGQWVAIDHTLLDTYYKQIEAATGTSSTGALSFSELPTAEQVTDANKKMQAVNQKYLFSTDQNTAVMHYKSFVGKETVDGRTVNHYKVTYDKKNLKTYFNELGKAIDSSKLNDWAKTVTGKNYSEAIGLQQLSSAVDKAKDNGEFDLRVDLQTKLVKSATFTQSNATMTVAQNYTGGDTYPFEIAIDSTDPNTPGKATIGFTMRDKMSKIDMKAKANFGGKDKTTFDMTGTFASTTDKPDVAMPTGAKQITEVMKQLGFDQSAIAPQPAAPTPTGSRL